MKTVNNYCTTSLTSSSITAVVTPKKSYAMPVKNMCAFLLHMTSSYTASLEPPPVKAHPGTAATGNFQPVGCKGKIPPIEEIEVRCAN